MTDSTKVLPVMVFSEFIKIRIDDQYKENIQHAELVTQCWLVLIYTVCKASF